MTFRRLKISLDPGRCVFPDAAFGSSGGVWSPRVSHDFAPGSRPVGSSSQAEPWRFANHVPSSTSATRDRLSAGPDAGNRGSGCKSGSSDARKRARAASRATRSRAASSPRFLKHCFPCARVEESFLVMRIGAHPRSSDSVARSDSPPDRPGSRPNEKCSMTAAA